METESRLALPGVSVEKKQEIVFMDMGEGGKNILALCRRNVCAIQ